MLVWTLVEFEFELYVAVVVLGFVLDPACFLAVVYAADVYAVWAVGEADSRDSKNDSFSDIRLSFFLFGMCTVTSSAH